MHCLFKRSSNCVRTCQRLHILYHDAQSRVTGESFNFSCPNIAACLLLYNESNKNPCNHIFQLFLTITRLLTRHLSKYITPEYLYFSSLSPCHRTRLMSRSASHLVSHAHSNHTVQAIKGYITIEKISNSLSLLQSQPTSTALRSIALRLAWT